MSKAFTSEADLCATFLDALDAGWTAFAETGGFDILLVRKEDGFQIGIEAKLRLNAIVLSQALEDSSWEWRKQGPDCRAVLVPEGAVVAGLESIVPHLALTVITIRSGLNWQYNARVLPSLPTLEGRYRQDSDWHELSPTERLPLPDYVPDVAAGSSAPIQLTKWKIAAIKVAVLAETRGFVTRSDFKALKIDIRRWIDGEWLKPDPRGFTLHRHPDFKAQHPRVYAEIVSDISKWAPKAFEHQPSLPA